MGGSLHEEAAGFLHDVVEDTEVTLETIYKIFVYFVGDLVESNTEDKTKSWKDRKIDTHKKIPFLSFEERVSYWQISMLMFFQ